MTLLPAYGRDYRSLKALLADLEADKDFILRAWDEPDTLANLSQLKDMKAGNVQVRYDKLRKTAVVNLTTKAERDNYEHR